MRRSLSFPQRVPCACWGLGKAGIAKLRTLLKEGDRSSETLQYQGAWIAVPGRRPG